MRFALTFRTFSSWNAAQARPAWTNSRLTVLIDTSATRAIARMLDPSQSIERIWTRFSMDSRFIGHCVAYVPSYSKHYFQFNGDAVFGEGPEAVLCPECR